MEEPFDPSINFQLKTVQPQTHLERDTQCIGGGAVILDTERANNSGRRVPSVERIGSVSYVMSYTMEEEERTTANLSA